MSTVREGSMRNVSDSSWNLVDQFIHGPLFFRKNLGSLVRKRNGSNRISNFTVWSDVTSSGSPSSNDEGL
eukprot:7301048-Prorocentrum_lima.AAC.1